MRRDLFDRVSSGGKRISGAFVSATVVPLPPGRRSECSVVISKKVTPTAVKRNLLRRRLLSLWREEEKKRGGRRHAVILHVKKGAAGLSFSELRHAVALLYRST